MSVTYAYKYKGDKRRGLFSLQYHSIMLNLKKKHTKKRKENKDGSRGVLAEEHRLHYLIKRDC